MIKFKLSLRELEKNIEDYKSYRYEIKSDISSFYSILSNVDFAWIDDNCEAFKKMANKDKEKLYRYFTYLDKYYNNIETFKDNIAKILSRYGCSRNANISYSNAKIQACINYLSYSKQNINEALKYILKIIYPSDFSRLDLVNEILNNLTWINNDISRYEDDICNFSNSITHEINDAYSRKSKVGIFNEKFAANKYSWSTVTLPEFNFKKFIPDEIIEANNTNADTSKFGKNDYVVSNSSKVNASEDNDISISDIVNNEYALNYSNSVTSSENNDVSSLDTLNNNYRLNYSDSVNSNAPSENINYDDIVKLKVDDTLEINGKNNIDTDFSLDNLNFKEDELKISEEIDASDINSVMENVELKSIPDVEVKGPSVEIEQKMPGINISDK